MNEREGIGAGRLQLSKCTTASNLDATMTEHDRTMSDATKDESAAEKERPENVGNPTRESRESLHARVQEGQQKANDAGVEPGPPEPKTI